MFETLLIDKGARIRDALQQLEDTERKTLFLVDERKSLVGALTDGDVRRWILSSGDLDGVVDAVCNRDPITAQEDYDLDTIKHQMLSQQIYCIPVVDENRKVLDILVWDIVFGDETLPATRAPVSVPVVIMAGGKGTRMAPFTSVLPKPLIPLGDKTVIELIVDSFTEFAVNEFYLSVNYKSRIIKSFFDELDPPYSVAYVYEDKPLGTAGSLQKLAGKLAGDLIVTNCDVIIRADYHDLLKNHQDNDNDITMVASLKNYSIPYGVCELHENGSLKEIREKPEYNFLVNTGLYVLKSDVLSLIPKNEVFHLTNLMDKVKSQGGRVGVFPISEKAWLDTGEWSEYRRAAAMLTTDRRKTPR